MVINPDEIKLIDMIKLEGGGVLFSKENGIVYHNGNKRVILVRFSLWQAYINIALLLACFAYFVYRNPLLSVAILITSHIFDTLVVKLYTKLINHE